MAAAVAGFIPDIPPAVDIPAGILGPIPPAATTGNCAGDRGWGGANVYPNFPYAMGSGGT